jgi:hypothetical protein
MRFVAYKVLIGQVFLQAYSQDFAIVFHKEVVTIFISLKVMNSEDDNTVACGSMTFIPSSDTPTSWFK